VVSLALALAIPTQVDGGGPFPDRNLVVFLSFSVIVVTLVGQGLTLPGLVRRLGVAAEDEGPADGVPAELVDRLRDRYRSRLAHLERQATDGQADGNRAFAELVSDLLGAQREELRRLRERGAVTPEVARRLAHGLDVEEARLDREQPG
jgi:hypothetical protein